MSVYNDIFQMQVTDNKTDPIKQQTPKLFVYKYIWVNRPPTNKNLKQLLNPYADKIFRESHWNLQSSFSHNRMHKIFPYIAKAPCSELYMQHKQEYPIFEMIGHVDFSLLQVLKLSNNHINNIQSLSFLKCAKLQTLDLSNNKIRSFKPLFKTVLKELVELKIDHNTCYELSLSRLYANKNKQINFKYSSHKRQKEPAFFSSDNDNSKISSIPSEKQIYSECSGPIMDIISFFVKLQNSKVANQMIYLMNEQDKIGITVLSKKKRKKLCDRIVRKFTKQKTLRTFCRKNPLMQNEPNFNDLSDDSPGMVDSLELYKEQKRIKQGARSS